jgi:hypothetical protein
MALLHKCDFPGCQKTEPAVPRLLAPISWHMVSYMSPAADVAQDFIFCPDHGGALRSAIGLGDASARARII